jgi:hypothetical protein
VRASARAHERFGRHFIVEDSRTRGHPLRVAFADDAATTVRVVVLHHAVDHVGHRLETTMRMPRRADGLVRRVLDRAELVEEEERVREVRVDAPGEGTPHREAGTLDGVMGGDDALDGSAHRRCFRRAQVGEDQRVFNSHSGHAAPNIVDVSTIPSAPPLGSLVDVDRSTLSTGPRSPRAHGRTPAPAHRRASSLAGC